MRSNNLKRHKQIQKDLLSLPNDEIENELKSRQEIKKKKEEKIQKVVEIAKENDLALPEDILCKKVNLLRKSMMFQRKLSAKGVNLLRK